jgi:hypothetical protein
MFADEHAQNWTPTTQTGAGCVQELNEKFGQTILWSHMNRGM